MVAFGVADGKVGVVGPGPEVRSEVSPSVLLGESASSSPGPGLTWRGLGGVWAFQVFQDGESGGGEVGLGAMEPDGEPGEVGNSWDVSPELAAAEGFRGLWVGNW